VGGRFVELPIEARDAEDQRGYAKAQEESFYQRHLNSNDDLVDIVAYCFMPTHIHLILRQLMKDGISIFMGKILNAEYTQEVGDFSVTLNRVDEGVEQCNEDTRMLQFRLVMSFDDGNRLVLVLDDQDVAAHWGYDDPNCADGCIFPGYAYYINRY
jgi:hypothetical protein